MSSYREPKTLSNVRLNLYRILSLLIGDSDINSELDELDREEFYRLKKVCIPTIHATVILAHSVKVSGKKQRDNAAADAEMAAKRASSDKENAGQDGPSDILGNPEDDDVIF